MIRRLMAIKLGDLIFWRGHVAMAINKKDIIHANAHHMKTKIRVLEKATETRPTYHLLFLMTLAMIGPMDLRFKLRIKSKKIPFSKLLLVSLLLNPMIEEILSRLDLLKSWRILRKLQKSLT